MELIEGVNAKVCSKCKILYSFENFNKDKNKKYGLSNQCKICRKKYSKKRYKENKEKLKEYSKEYYNKNIEKIKEKYNENKEEIRKYQKIYKKNNDEKIKEKRREYYQKNKEKYQEKYNENKEYFKQKSREYRENNVERLKKNAKEYYQKNKEKKYKYHKKYLKENSEKIRASRYNRIAKKQNANGIVTEEQLKESLKFFDNKCAYTNKEMNIISFDHIVPFNKGGENYIWNIVPSELIINGKKSDNDLEEWYKAQEFYSDKKLNKIYEYIDYMKNKYGEE